MKNALLILSLCFTLAACSKSDSKPKGAATPPAPPADAIPVPIDTTGDPIQTFVSNCLLHRALHGLPYEKIEEKVTDLATPEDPRAIKGWTGIYPEFQILMGLGPMEEQIIRNHAVSTVTDSTGVKEVSYWMALQDKLDPNIVIRYQALCVIQR